MIDIFKILYPSKSMKRKMLDIEDDIKDVVSSICKDKFWINRYGAYDIDPKNLVIWICVESDKIKLKLASDQILLNKIRDILIRHDYPKHAIDFVFIGFESQETVDRESNGNWYNHFK